MLDSPIDDVAVRILRVIRLAFFKPLGDNHRDKPAVFVIVLLVNECDESFLVIHILFFYYYKGMKKIRNFQIYFYELHTERLELVAAAKDEFYIVLI